MSDDTKGRTMIGTAPPVARPRTATAAGTQDAQPYPPATPAAYPAQAQPYPAQPYPPAAPAGYPAQVQPYPPAVAGEYPAPAQPPWSPADPAPVPVHAAPTIGLGPRPAPPPGTLPGGDDPDGFVGQELCGYAIQRKLAEGGMGVVYLGQHRKIGRFAAIKVLKLEFCRAEEVVERFYQEARAVNAINHENIVDIYDFGRDPHGRVFFVMEYLEGEPLSARLRRSPLSWGEAFPILEQTLRALKAAHDKGFVHRDLKPDNIWLRYVDGRVQVKLLDFGIAKLVGAESPKDKLTRTGSIIGTPHYMSPEQINGAREVDHRSDLYALGVITYEMFAGTTPFVGDTLQAIMTGHLFTEPPRLSGIPAQLGVPLAIAEIVERMLVKDAAGRYASVADVLADLHDVSRNQRPANAETLRQTRPLAAPAMAVGGASAPRKGRTRARVIGLGLAAAVTAGAGVAIWASQRQPAAPVAVAQPALKPGTTTEDHPPVDVEPPLDDAAARRDALTALRATLKGTEPRVRVAGSDALGKIKDQPSAPALSELTEKDPDPEVRGHAGGALGAMGAASAARLLARLETAAAPPLKVWYASALARLGDPQAAKRLVGYARSPDLAVSFPAALALSETSRPGDRQAIAALRALVKHEAELNQRAPYAGALILSRMAALRDGGARKTLHQLLEHDDEGARLAAAEGLAKLGDDAGKQVLQDVLGNPASRNRLVAAVAQIPLGEYTGLPVITEHLRAKDPGERQLAARALGDIGERTSLRPLIALASDADWTVRIAAAAAIVAIVGLDPQVLAQASVDWTQGALASQDWAVRRAAAGVLSDLPEKQAVPLLAQAIADPDPGVRLAAARSAGKMKSADAATKIAAAAVSERDPMVKEQQVKALGAIGSAATHDTLAQISQEPGRIGVIAAGSLIAVGDVSAKAKLDMAMADGSKDLRLAAMEAASAANNAIVVPTLHTGVADRVFEVRFAAAEGLAAYGADKPRAAEVLNEGLARNDADVIGRAMAALTRLGEKPRNPQRSPAELLDSPEPRLRLAAVPAVRALPPSEAVPLLRRLVADADQDVRRAGVDAIEVVVPTDRDLAIKLYKPLVSDDDPVVRSKASGRLAQLAPPPAPPPPAPPPAPTTPPAGDALLPVKLALDDAAAAAGEATTASAAFDAAAAELTRTLAAPSRDEAATDQVDALATRLGDAAGKLDTVAARAERAAKSAAEAAGAQPSPDAAKLVAEAAARAQSARTLATAARDQAAAAASKAHAYREDHTIDTQMAIDAGRVALLGGKLAQAKQYLDTAARQLRKSGAKDVALDDLYGQLYVATAKRSSDPAGKRRALQQAQEHYRHVAATGAGAIATRAKALLDDIADDLAALGSP